DECGGDNADSVQIAAAATVRQAVGALTVNSSGTVDLNGKQLIVNGTTTLGIGQAASGDITTAGAAGGTLFTNGNITVVITSSGTIPSGTNAASAGAPPATITAAVDLVGATRTITLADRA